MQPNMSCIKKAKCMNTRLYTPMTKRLIDLFLIENGRYQLKQMYTDAYIITPHLFPEISTELPEMFCDLA